MLRMVESPGGKYLASVFLLAEVLGVDVCKLIDDVVNEEKTLPEDQAVQAGVYTATINENAPSGGRR